MKEIKKRALENLRKELENMDANEFVLLHKECFQDQELIWDKNLSDELFNGTQIFFSPDPKIHDFELQDKIWKVCNLEEIIEQKYLQFLLGKSEKERLDWFEDELSTDEINYHLGVKTSFTLSKQKKIIDFFYDHYYTEWSLNSLRWFLYKNLEKISVSSTRNKKIDSLLDLSL